jgi:hypothetical protein
MKLRYKTYKNEIWKRNMKVRYENEIKMRYENEIKIRYKMIYENEV